MYNVKLAEQQRPVLLRDGAKGPMRVVTANNWVRFETIGNHMVDDNSLVIEVVESSQPEAVATPQPEAVVEAEPVATIPTRKTRTRRKPKADQA